MADHARLAIDGGEPVISRSLGVWPFVEPDDIDRVRAVLESNRLNYWTGTRGLAFEAALQSRFGCRGIAMANGTVTLETALRVLGVGPGDEVIVPARTFIATASAVAMLGARPVVCDVELDSGNMSVATVQPLVTERTKALIPVHVGGWPVDMPALMAFARQKGLSVIEDCAQAIGATIDGQQVGTFGDFGSFSFCQDKIITTGGEGGALLAADESLWERAWTLKDHGKDPSLMFGDQPGDGALFRWVHTSFGTNLRMTEMQAELGLCGLERLDGYLEARRANAQTLADGLADVAGLEIPEAPAHYRHAFYRVHALVDESALAEGWSRDRILRAVRAEGAPCSQGVCAEIYREKAFERAGYALSGELPVAAELGRRSLAFLVHPTLTAQDMRAVVEAVRKVFAAASEG